MNLADADGLVDEVLGLAVKHGADSGRPAPHLRTRRGAARFVKNGLVLKARLAPGARVLDLGCGDGELAYVLHRLGFDVVAAGAGDAPPPFVRSVPGNDELQAVPYSALDLDSAAEQPGDPFGAVCLSDAFGEMSSFAPFLARARTVLRPDGMLFIFFFPNRFSWLEALADRRPGYESPHTRRLTPKELSLMVGWHGFRVLEATYEEILPVSPVHLPSRLRRPYRRCEPVVGATSTALLKIPLVKHLSTSFRVVATRDDQPAGGVSTSASTST